MMAAEKEPLSILEQEEASIEEVDEEEERDELDIVERYPPDEAIEVPGEELGPGWIEVEREDGVIERRRGHVSEHITEERLALHKVIAENAMKMHEDRICRMVRFV
jgi:hypothetical protein